MQEKPEITSVYIWTNINMIIVFDQYGQQMPEYQGPTEDVLEKVKLAAPTTAQWHEGQLK